MLDIIIKYGLSIRQIPLVVTYRWIRSVDKPLKDNEVLEVWKPDLAYFKLTYPSNYQKMMDNFYSNFPDGRTFVVETKIPKNAGFWMCKQVDDTGSSVKWNMDTDNLAPTLEGSINLFLKTLNNEH